MFTTRYQITHDPPPRRLREIFTCQCLLPCCTYIGLATAPAWKQMAVAVVVGAAALAVGIATLPLLQVPRPYYQIAFIGNSMMYYNDFPRFMEALSDNHITQDCCLHGDASLETILTWGSGTYQIWHTGVARMDTYNDDGHTAVQEGEDDDGGGDDEGANDDEAAAAANEDNDDNSGGHQIRYDMGACTVEQLLLGYDYDLDMRMEEMGYSADDDNDDAYTNAEQQLTDDVYTYNDGKNPCFLDPSYYYYRQELYEANGPPKFDFIIINDRTRAPARRVSRNASLEVLEDRYIDWFLETGATPIFLVTYGYDTPYRDMSGLDGVSTFTSLTYEGYKEYADLVASYLPATQQPRLAPVGLAFLMVYEENPSLWQKLFHIDQIHASPHGTFLQGCVVHHTIFGRLPPKNVALRNDMSALWNHARRMQPRKHRRLPMPTREEAAYLYHIAERVTVRKQLPKTFTKYQNREASDYIPNDSIYADNDIY